MQKLSTENRAFLQLLLAGSLWGFAFVATIWTLKGLSPAAIIFYRFLGATIFGLLFVPSSFKAFLSELRPSFPIGLLLAATLIPQAWGLKFTTATNSAFITILYVVIVPMIGAIQGTEKIPRLHWVWTALAMFGTALIIDLKSLDVNYGDFLTLICAGFAALHILAVDRRANKTKSAFAMNLAQSFWCALAALPLMWIDNRSSLFNLDGMVWIGLIMLTLGSSLVAFYLQIVAQKNVKASVASLLFLLESPFSGLFAFLLLDERLSPVQLLGAVVIFISCYLASRFGAKTVTQREVA
jgi:drug/metabolite transporter (DMT)-like permease